MASRKLMRRRQHLVLSLEDVDHWRNLSVAAKALQLHQQEYVTWGDRLL